ncbi:hypothetical protein SLOPH_1095 [Spraguea lophii 42_110]|uniref:Uncharacterized protein n=1 Tax=Spraguea lophii (strain 42_110) TaxID=1358809 RepID=S7W9X3_SPRLO|nr:hypothetical protein SLOPH_1095 [Spraguea lophii 42_110]
MIYINPMNSKDHNSENEQPSTEIGYSETESDNMKHKSSDIEHSENLKSIKKNKKSNNFKETNNKLNKSNSKYVKKNDEEYDASEINTMNHFESEKETQYINKSKKGRRKNYIKESDSTDDDFEVKRKINSKLEEFRRKCIEHKEKYLQKLFENEKKNYDMYKFFYE